jgi:hypothetical protein
MHKRLELINSACQNLLKENGINELIIPSIHRVKFRGRLTGLPDGIFSNQKSKFRYNLQCLAMEDVGIFYGHLIYFTAIWYTLWTFAIFLW